MVVKDVGESVQSIQSTSCSLRHASHSRANHCSKGYITSEVLIVYVLFCFCAFLKFPSVALCTLPSGNYKLASLGFRISISNGKQLMHLSSLKFELGHGEFSMLIELK